MLETKVASGVSMFYGHYWQFKHSSLLSTVTDVYFSTEQILNHYSCSCSSGTFCKNSVTSLRIRLLGLNLKLKKPKTLFCKYLDPLGYWNAEMLPIQVY